MMNEFNNDNDLETDERAERGPRRGHGPGKGKGPGRGPRGGHPGRPRGGEGRRIRRGTAARSALFLLNERPMHGYEIISELETRTNGLWRPSPGSMYPALSRLEDKGLIESNEVDDGKRQYTITDDGKARLSQRDADAPFPWAEAAEPRPVGLRDVIAELEGQARQIGRFGSTEQHAAALEILSNARSGLYSVLAEPK